MVFIKKVKSPLIVPYLVPYQHSLTMNLILRAHLVQWVYKMAGKMPIEKILGVILR